MIRVAAIAGGFLAVTLTLILVQKDNQPRPEATLSPTKSEPSQATKRETVRSTPGLAPQKVRTPDVARAQSGVSLVDASKRAQPVERGHTALTQLGNNTARTPLDTSTRELEQLIATALEQGQSPAYIAALIQNGATVGSPSPAPRLVRDGALDITSLIGALTAPEPKEQAVSNPVTYTVQAGDTLAAISYRFYGSTAHGSNIIRSNPDNFKSQPSLAIGQRLVIPAL